MKTLKMMMLGATAVALVACGGDKEPEVTPEEMPANQQELAPAPDTVDSMVAEPAVEPAAKGAGAAAAAPAKKAEERVGTQSSADAPIKSTGKKSRNASAPVVEEPQPVQAEDAAPVKVTKKKKRE